MDGSDVAEYNDIYRRAQYYDIAFRRDVAPEVGFLAALFERHAGRAARSIADLACGPAYHARLFARQGMAAVGLDLRPEMIDFARDEARKEGVDGIDWMVGDIRDFELPYKVDIALTSYDSIDCLSEQDEIIAHFQAVARNLADDGLYVTEATHPRDCSLFDYGAFSYGGARDGVSVEIDWAVNHPVADPITMVVRPEVVMRVNDHGQMHEFRDQGNRVNKRVTNS